MTHFSVDVACCKKDHICILECPLQLIISDKENNLPKFRPDAENLCILCGHCVAVCPYGACSLSDLPKNEFKKIKPELEIAFEQSDQFLKSRRSIRTFKKTAVNHETLEKIMDTVRFSPTASHQQKLRWIMIENPKKTHEIAGLIIEWMKLLQDSNPDMAKRYGVPNILLNWQNGFDMVLRGAPNLAIAVANQKMPWAESDSAIALTYIELAAHSLGVGACWAGFFTYAVNNFKPIRQALNLAENEKVYGGQMLGYPKYKYHRLPYRKPLNLTRQ